MEEEKQKAYSEVVEILKLIEDEERIEKLPFEVVELIKRNSDPTYKPEISREIPLENQNLRKETYAILGWIASKYWGEEICEVVKKTEEISVYNDIEPEAMELKDNLPMLVSDLKWHEKIKTFLIKFFKLVFRLGENKVEKGVNE